MIISAKQRNAAHHGELVVTDLSEEFKETVKHLRDFQLSEEELKQAEKQRRKPKTRSKGFKSKIKNGEKAVPKPCVYVLDFKGDISASETTALREEISAIINVAKPMMKSYYV